MERGRVESHTDVPLPTQVTKQESVQNTGGLPLTVFEHFTVDSTLWSPCSGQDGLSGILNLNLRVAFGTTNKTNGMPAFGYFGPYAIVDSGFEYPVTEKLTFSLRQCSPGQENANATVP